MNKENCGSEKNLQVCCPEGINTDILKFCCIELLSDCCETLAKDAVSKPCCPEGLNNDELTAHCSKSLANCYAKRVVSKCQEKGANCCTSDKEVEQLEAFFEKFIKMCFEKIDMKEGSVQCCGNNWTADELKTHNLELMNKCFSGKDCAHKNCCEEEDKSSSKESSCCDTANSSCCSPRQSDKEESISTKVAKITIDGIELDINDPSKNLVEIAKEAKITIPAPSYHAKRKHGCCKACVVEADGEQTYACGTKARDGMNVIVNREDLNALRKERLLAYKKGIENDSPMKCNRS